MSVRRVLTLLAGAALVAGLLAPTADAGPQTKWFTDSVGSSSPATSTSVIYPVSSASQTLYFRLTNSATSNQPFGSADIDLLQSLGWTVVGVTTSPVATAASLWTETVDTNGHVIHLRNSGNGTTAAIPAGGYLELQLSFNSGSGGIITPGLTLKQSNDFSDSSKSGTSNVFGQLAPLSSIFIGAGPPAKIVYAAGHAPSDVQVTTSSDTHYMCPSVQAAVEDVNNNVVSWLPATAVTVASTGSPGLQLNGSSTLSATTSSGVATFGNALCTGGLTASAQGVYAMTARTTVAAGAGYDGGTFSTSAVNYTVYLTLCGATCDIPLSGSQTNAGIHATGGDSTLDPAIALISAAGTVPSGCDSAHISYRPDQTTLFLDGHDKSVDVGWSKKVTNLDPRNGTPFWPVCIVAPYNVYVSNGAGGVTTADATNGVILASCNTAGVQTRSDGKPDLPCVSNLYKNAASEHAVVWLPNVPGDPHLF